MNFWYARTISRIRSIFLAKLYGCPCPHIEHRLSTWKNKLSRLVNQITEIYALLYSKVFAQNWNWISFPSLHTKLLNQTILPFLIFSGKGIKYRMCFQVSFEVLLYNSKRTFVQLKNYFRSLFRILEGRVLIVLAGTTARTEDAVSGAVAVGHTFGPLLLELSVLSRPVAFFSFYFPTTKWSPW